MAVRPLFIVLAVCGWGVATLASAATAQRSAVSVSGGLPSRTTTSVTYEARRTTKVDLVGTPLMPRTRGEAVVKTEAAGPVRIKAKVRDLMAATQFGTEYLTFVLWAIPPRGRAKNLGELRLDDGAAEIQVTSDAQTFALIVTAEPYYAVTTPSDVVVMENAVRPETRGRTSTARLQYQIVPRGAYVPEGVRHSLPQPNRREPPDVQEARNAIAIAQMAQAGRYAPRGLATARRLLMQVEQLVATRGSTRDIISQSRAAVQVAEEARLQSTDRRIAEAELVARAEAAAREQAAKDAAAQEAAARRAAEEERQRAEQSAQDEAELAPAEAQAHTARAEALHAKADQDRAVLRATLLRQFSGILETRDTARGLVVNLGDALFETEPYKLRPPAREKLARVAGIVLAHPGLSVQVEGFTDSAGTAALNERLSRQRAETVGGFLVAEGVALERVTARGFDSNQPVASKDTPEGREQNRRVQLVVTGEVIGTPIGHSRH